MVGHHIKAHSEKLSTISIYYCNFILSYNLGTVQAIILHITVWEANTSTGARSRTFTLSELQLFDCEQLPIVNVERGTVLDFSLVGAIKELQITAPVVLRPGQWSHAVTAVRPHSILGVDSAGDDANVEVMLRAPMVVRARAQGGGRHLVHVRPVGRLLHWKQPTRLLSLAFQFLKQTNVKFMLYCLIKWKKWIPVSFFFY